MNQLRCISFETAKQLREKGLAAEAEWNYFIIDGKIFIGKSTIEEDKLKLFIEGNTRAMAIDKQSAIKYPAYDRDELYALLPDRLEKGSEVAILQYEQKYGMWRYGYKNATGIYKLESYGISEAEAIAKLMLMLLEHKMANSGE